MANRATLNGPATPVVTIPAGTPLGFQQIPAATLAAATPLTPPVGATYALVSPTIAGVMWRDDGVAPTAAIGMPIALGQMVALANLAALQFIAAAAISLVGSRQSGCIVAQIFSRHVLGGRFHSIARPSAEATAELRAANILVDSTLWIDAFL
jgi:hypothetical protein